LTLARQGETIDETESVSLTDLVGKCWGTVDTEPATLEITDEMTFQAIATDYGTCSRICSETLSKMAART